MLAPGNARAKASCCVISRRAQAPPARRSSRAQRLILEYVGQAEVELIDSRSGLVAIPLIIRLHGGLGDRLVGQAQCVLDTAVGRVFGEGGRRVGLGVVALVAQEGRQILARTEKSENVVSSLHVAAEEP